MMIDGTTRHSSFFMAMKTPGRLLLAILAITVPLFPAQAVADRAGEVPSSRLQLADQKQLDRLTEGIASHREKIDTSKEREQALDDELNALDKRLQAKQEAIIHAQEILLKEESYLQEKELELTLCREEKHRTEQHIKNRLQAYYKTGDISIINAIFSTATLPELLNTQEYFHYLLEYDKITVQDYRNRMVILDDARDEMLNGKEQLLATILDIKGQEKDLILIRQERVSLLAKIQKEKQLYEMALAEIQKSAAKLSRRLDAYQGVPVIKSKNKKRKFAQSNSPQEPPLAPEFTDYKGRLPAPVLNGTISTFFGDSEGIYGITVHSNGIDIDVNSDTEVSSIYDGETIFAGELEGYGKVVIIDHGQRYFSLLSQLSAIYLKKGDLVQQGTVVGAISKTRPDIPAKALHVEIRQGATPLDPLLWLDKSQFTL